MAVYPLLIQGNVGAGEQLLNRLNPTLLDIYSRLGQAVASCTQWLEGDLSPVYLSATEFTLAGDATSLFSAGRMVRAKLGGGYVFAAVQGSAYDDAAEVTTVTLDAAVLDATLEQVNPGIITPGADAALPVDVVRTFGDQTIAGVKSFASHPLLPGDPAQDNEPANKGYVDGQVGAIVFPDPPAGWLAGLDLESKDADEVYIKAGGVEISGGLYYAPATITKQFTGLAADRWHFLMASPPASGDELAAGDFSLQEAAPAFDGVKNGWYSGGARCIGCLLTDGAGEIVSFRQTRGWHRLRDTNWSLFTTSRSTGFTALALDLPALCAPLLVHLRGYLQQGTYDSDILYVREVGSSLASSEEQALCQTVGIGQLDIGHQLITTDSSRQIEYKAHRPSGGTLALAALAFRAPW